MMAYKKMDLEFGRLGAKGERVLEALTRTTDMAHTIFADIASSKEAFDTVAERVVMEMNQALRRRMNNELNFPPSFEGLVLGCIDADFCK